MSNKDKKQKKTKTQEEEREQLNWIYRKVIFYRDKENDTERHVTNKRFNKIKDYILELTAACGVKFTYLKLVTYQDGEQLLYFDLFVTNIVAENLEENLFNKLSEIKIGSKKYYLTFQIHYPQFSHKPLYDVDGKIMGSVNHRIAQNNEHVELD